MNNYAARKTSRFLHAGSPFGMTLTDARTYEVGRPELAMVGRSAVAIGVPGGRRSRVLIYDRLVTASLTLHIDAGRNRAEMRELES